MAMYIENPRLEEELIAQRQGLGRGSARRSLGRSLFHVAGWRTTITSRLVLEFSVSLERRPSPSQARQSPSGRESRGVRGGLGHTTIACRTSWFFWPVPTAENHDAFWTGAADFIIEITSPRDRTYEKIPFYSRIGVREVADSQSPEMDT